MKSKLYLIFYGEEYEKNMILILLKDNMLFFTIMSK